jgi:hypothetical protein
MKDWRLPKEGLNYNSKLSLTIMNRKEEDIQDNRERNRGLILVLMYMDFIYFVALNHCLIFT